MAESKVWLITGSSRGLGRSIAAAAAKSGARVMATARRPEDLDDLVAEYPDRVRAFALDVTDRQAARAAVQATIAEFGRLDVVVNNAGYANSGAIEEMTDEDFRDQVEANLFGVVNVTRAALPVMRGQRSGVLVQVSSIGGRVGGTPGMGAYQTAKFAVEGFSEALASEVGPLGIKVIIIEPGAFRTDWQGSSMVRHEAGPDYAARSGRSTSSARIRTAPSRATRTGPAPPSSRSSPTTTRRAGCRSARTRWPSRSPPVPHATPRPRSGPASAARPTIPMPGTDQTGASS
jgi:NAD(P)-dependent dehydrogenase (short-subunit alcohol dehydrogenase family)